MRDIPWLLFGGFIEDGAEAAEGITGPTTTVTLQAGGAAGGVYVDWGWVEIESLNWEIEVHFLGLEGKDGSAEKDHLP